MLERFAGMAKTDTPAQQASDVKGHVDLAKILVDHSFLATFTEKVSISYAEGTKEENFPDTDDEKANPGAKINKIEAKKPGKKFAGIGNKSKKKCLLKQVDWEYDEAIPQKNTQQLSEKLALDAYEIANSSGEGKHTTCLCVLLRDTRGYVHKIVFHNTKGQLVPKMRSKAADLNYTVRNIRKGHAESQFVSFLFERTHQKNPPMEYSHIIGLGCSRKNCPHYASLLKFFLGTKYQNFHAYAYEEIGKKQEVKMTRRVIDGKSAIEKKIPEQIDCAKTKYPGSEIGPYPTNDYLLPDNIKAVIPQLAQTSNPHSSS